MTHDMDSEARYRPADTRITPESAQGEPEGESTGIYGLLRAVCTGGSGGIECRFPTCKTLAASCVHGHDRLLGRA